MLPGVFMEDSCPHAAAVGPRPVSIHLQNNKNLFTTVYRQIDISGGGMNTWKTPKTGASKRISVHQRVCEDLAFGIALVIHREIYSPKEVKGRQKTRECYSPSQITQSDLHVIAQALQGSTITTPSLELYGCNNNGPTSRSLN